MASKPSATWKKIKWTLLVLLGACLLVFLEYRALSLSGPSPSLFQTAVPSTPTYGPAAPTDTGTPGGQPPRPTTPPPGYVASADGGRVYCGGQQSPVWLDVPRGFSPEEGVQFYCEPRALPDAWNERGYVIYFEPEYTQMVRVINMTFEIDPTRAQGPFMGRFAEIGSNEWIDLPTGYNEGILRAMLELDPSLPIFAFPGQFIIALFEEPPTPTPTPTPTFTNTPRPVAPESSTPKPPSPKPPTNTPRPLPHTSTPSPTSGPVSPGDQGQRSGLLLILGLLAVVVVAAGVLLFVFLSRSKKPGRQSGGGAQLILVRGQARPRSMTLSRPVVRIGRSPKDNDVVVNDPPVSGHHAEIRAKEGRHAIRDLNSTNGTFVNGQRLTELRPLRNGDRITMGNTEWQYRLGGGTESLSRS